MGVWLRKSSHGIHRIHRSFVALVLPRNSRNSQKFCCVCSPTEFTEFTEVWLRRFSHRIHGIHRSFVASHSSINLESVLWKVLLCQKVPCVLCVLWEYSLPRISQINTDGWLRKSSHGIHRIHRSLGAVGCVGMAGCHTLLICAHPCQSVGGASQPEGSVLSVRICGRLFSARRFRVFRAFCGRYFSTRRVRSVGDYSFSMRKRLTMPKTRA